MWFEAINDMLFLLINFCITMDIVDNPNLLEIKLKPN